MVSPEYLHVDPALEEILYDLARDPRSSLLRVSRPACRHRITDSWEALSRWTPGLTVAEKELLDVHRAEFAALLIRRWLVENELRPNATVFMTRGSSARAPVKPIERAQLDVAAKAPWSESVAGVGASLAVLLNTDLILSSDQASSLVATAVRLHPNMTARLVHVQDLVRTGQRRTALKSAGRLLDLEWRPELRSYCWENLALAHGNQWRASDLAKWYRLSSAIDEPRFDSLSWWLLMAAQDGDVDGVRRAAEGLDSLYASDDMRVDYHVRRQIEGRFAGLWAPRPGVRRVFDEALPTVGATARRLLSVLE